MSGTYEMVTVPQYVLDELDVLREQRDALVTACKSILVFLTGDEYHEYYYQAQVRQLRAALALVKGEQKSDDATA